MPALPRCDVLVLEPVESLWCQIHAGWAHGFAPQNPAIQQLEQQYAELFGMLLGRHIDFGYGNEDLLLRHGRIEHEASCKPVLAVGQARYRVAVLGGMTTVRRSTLRLLQQFAQSGGQVVFVGEAPGYVDAAASADPAQLRPHRACPGTPRNSPPPLRRTWPCGWNCSTRPHTRSHDS